MSDEKTRLWIVHARKMHLLKSAVLLILSLSHLPRLSLSWSITRASLSTLRMASSPSDDAPQHVVVAGAGVIGLSTSYYLATNFGIHTTVVDPTGQVASAASGKAGGFLALDWNDWSPVGQLARRSFSLHQELADTLGADNIQYRRLTCAAISVNPARSGRPSGKKLTGIEWIKEDEVQGMRGLGDESTIAQVHPKLLCENLWKIASTPQNEGGVGSTLLKGRVVSPAYKDDKLCGAKLADGTILECDAILFACGPWDVNIMQGVKYHSIVIPTPRVLSQSVFFDGLGDPEVYPRPDSTAYCTGFPDQACKVTERPGEEEVRPEAASRILEAVRQASGATGNDDGVLSAAPTTTQACYLPSAPDSLPVMGLLPTKYSNDNCFIATGHTCWGILLGPASGESMAHLIATGECNKYVDLRPFDPARFPNIGLCQS
jgi:glycine/D-amino acid oxidase-like deaminating enzyme